MKAYEIRRGELGSAPASDFTSALSMVKLDARVGFINADVSLYLMRPPVGEWFCFDAQGSALPSGLSLGAAEISDIEGIVGRSMVSRIANARA